MTDPFDSPTAAPSRVFQIEVAAKATDGMRKEGTVQQFTVYCDEGAGAGGTGTAPTPISYLLLSVSFCMLTQTRRSAEALGVEVDEISVHTTGTFHNSGVYEEGTSVSGCSGIELSLRLESSFPADRVMAAVHQAINACYVLQALRNPVQVSVRSSVNGRGQG
jgi:uncharacterized OsmC-like protein